MERERKKTRDKLKILNTTVLQISQEIARSFQEQKVKIIIMTIKPTFTLFKT